MFRRNNKQLAEYEAAARMLQWRFIPEGDKSMISWLKDFRLLKTGSSRLVAPMLMYKGHEMEHTCVFDYVYTVSTGKSSQTFKQTVYFRYSKALALPHFILMPERWYHRLGTYFGMQDIDFVEYPIFSKNYLLQGKDEDYIRYHFDHPEMIRFFDQQGSISMEGMNYLFILYSHNVQLPHDQIVEFVKVGDLLHDYLADKTPDIHLPDINYE